MVICLHALQKAGGALKLVNLNRRNLELVLLTKLSTVFQIFADEQEAVNSFFPDREIKHFDILSFVQQQQGGGVSRRHVGPSQESDASKRARRRRPSGLTGLDGAARSLEEILAAGPRCWLFTKSVARSASSPFLTWSGWLPSTAIQVIGISQDDAGATAASSSASA